MIKFMVDDALCTGCQICALTCSFVKEGVANTVKSRIHVARPDLNGTEILYCTQCGDCIKECPEEALSFHSRTGAVILDQTLCHGCGFCFIACSNGYLKGHPLTGRPLLCDFCHGEPECIKNCPVQAIQVEKGERRFE